jgi:hypothetical protein
MGATTCPARVAPSKVAEQYGRRTLSDADPAVAAAALLLGYAVQVQREPNGTFYEMADEYLPRKFQAASRCWSLASLPLHPLFKVARDRLRRVERAMEIINKHVELVAPPP